MQVHDPTTDPATPRRDDVLVVDDEPVVRAGVRKVLESAGLQVATARDCATALAHPAAAACRLVLCDLILPDGSGVELIRTLHRRRPELPLVLITGYPTPEQEAKALEAGAALVLAKPFEASELLLRVRAVLERRPAATATVKEKRP